MDVQRIPPDVVAGRIERLGAGSPEILKLYETNVDGRSMREERVAPGS
jgi:hypothetical protein